MNFIDRRHEPMPAGAAQTHEQPTVEKSAEMRDWFAKRDAILNGGAK